jgi:hypothetical protein
VGLERRRIVDEIVSYNAAEITAARAPEKVVEEAVRAATVLKDIVVKTGGAIKLGANEHLKVESWITLAKFYGLSPRIARKQYVEFGPGCRGFEVTAELVNTETGVIVSVAESMCLSDEEKWSERPKYERGADGTRRQVGVEHVPLFQLLSMAQTRAVSKVCATALRWVVVLAGYSGTPAEEIGASVIEPPPITIPRPRAKQPEPASQRAEAPAEPASDNVMRGVVIDRVTVKAGEKGGRPYTKYGLKIGDAWVGTFDTVFGELAAACQTAGTPVNVEYKRSGDFLNLVTLEVAE